MNTSTAFNNWWSTHKRIHALECIKNGTIERDIKSIDMAMKAIEPYKRYYRCGWDAAIDKILLERRKIMDIETIPNIVKRAINRTDHDISWVWRWAEPHERKSVDAWLLAIDHPLAMQPGTPEYRFAEIVYELIEKLT